MRTLLLTTLYQNQPFSGRTANPKDLTNIPKPFVFFRIHAIIRAKKYKGGDFVTFQQLQYLLEVRDTKSISKAAANLFISNSSVSAAVSNLEEELGFAIFNRSQKGLVPTANGLRILEYAERICKIYDQMGEVRNDTVRHFKVSFRGYYPLSHAFARLLKENRNRSDIRFHATSLLRDEMIRQIANQELELSLIVYFEPRVRVLEAKLAKYGLEFQVLKTVPAAVMVGPGHRLYDAVSVNPRDLEDDMIVDVQAMPIVRSDYLHGVMCFKPENVLICNNGSTQHIIEQGLAYSITVMPPEHERKKSICRYVPLTGVNHQVILVTNPNTPLSPEGIRFLELLDEELDKI